MRPASSLILLVCLAGCVSQEHYTGEDLARRLLIVDTHIDVPYRLNRRPEDISKQTAHGQFDYPRALAGGLNVPFMSIYVPAEAELKGTARQLADELIDMMEFIARAHPDKFAIVSDADLASQAVDDQVISLALGMENGAPIEGDLANLEHFYKRGIRYITLAHSKSNHISDSSYDPHRQWGGLSPFGRELIVAMNDIGMMIDVSHISDEAFYDVIALSKAPVIASHSSVRHFIPGFERNMNDTMLRALARNGGVMQLNVGSTFLTDASRRSSLLRNEKLREAVKREGIAVDDTQRLAEIRDEVYDQYPLTFANLSDILDHIDYVVNLVGVDHIGIGSDFDGVGDSLPNGFKDVSHYPALIDGLLARNYSKRDIEKILGGNLIRVWQDVEALRR